MTKKTRTINIGPTPEEKAKLDALLAWENQSRHCHLIIGGYWLCPACGAQNNPNYAYCRECHHWKPNV